MGYVIGIDLGTSATKTIMINEAGCIVSSAEYAYPMIQPHNGWAEQDPLVWKKAVLTTLKQVVEQSGAAPDQIIGIGLSGQMHGSVLIDENDEPIGNTILWCDQRSSQQAEEMLELLPLEKWLELTANPPLAAWTAAKILWIRENESEKWAKCKHILLPKDYIRLVLTGVYATDVADASGMQLLDVKNRCWSDEILDTLHINRDMLGTVYESQEVTGTLLPEIAQFCGLSPNTVVVAGGSDNACAAIGSGVVNQGQAFVTLGTSAVVYSHFDAYTAIPDGGLHVCCCAVPGCWHSMGGPMSAGLSVEWFKNNFCQDLIQRAKDTGKSFYTLLTELVDQIPIGSEHLIFLPFLMGERTPHMDPLYRGSFVGLSAIHTQAHMLRAIMEGVVFCLADCNDILREQGITITSLRACGGGSRSIVYQKMLADLFRCPIHTLQGENGAAYGAAILAGVGSGLYSSVREACAAFIHEADTVDFSPEDADLYDKYHQIYDNVYLALKSQFSALAAI